ncbi:hypothetical protein [Roseovarius aquimarinus]|uniref:PRC-barrel domain-containing protein n=1 Tax=Roseovarius aquimarinus TaxID=1229156 RepID=A0ABW7I367_9RHOB
MKRFVTLATATILATTPALAADDLNTRQQNQPTSEVYSGKFPPDSYSSTGLVGSDVVTTERGVGNTEAPIDGDKLKKIGQVQDVVMTDNNEVAGILVDPVDTLDDDEMLWFFPRSNVSVIDDVAGEPRYAIDYTAGEMSEIERVERSNWM